MLRVIICGWNCENTIDRCIESVKMQSWGGDYSCQIVIDEDGDEERQYLVKSTIDAISMCAEDLDDIIVCVDADDFLADEDALKIVAETYEKNPNLLLTHGSYVTESDNKVGKFCGAYEPGEDFRTATWRGSHLKTFKYRLWQQLAADDLKDDKGEWFKCCADRAMMIPMMEIAGHDRIQYIPTILYCYNNLNPDSVWKTNRSLSIETRELISARPRRSRIDIL